MKGSVAQEKASFDLEDDKASKTSLLESIINELFFEKNIWISLTSLNIIIAYFSVLLIISGHHTNYIYLFAYFPMIYLLYILREAKKERMRQEIAHRMPFFGDALANVLSVGATLEQAFIQCGFYLKGEIKADFNNLVIKNSLGSDLGTMLREIDAKFPKTGLNYLISLLEQYRELGVGISPLLKKISGALRVKEEAEEKIRSILSTGSNYARLSIGVFAGLFLVLSFLLKDQIALLFSPGLKSIFLFLLAWTGVGILVVMRITSMQFTKHSALRPQIAEYVKKSNMAREDMYYYSGLNFPEIVKKALEYAPLPFGFVGAYATSWHSGNFLMIMLGFIGGAIACWYAIHYILKGLVEDQLIKTVETFPEILHVFVIGLNSGLNAYCAFLFAEEGIKRTAPRLLSQELSRTRFAMECGEEHVKTWRRLAKTLPFETMIDFCEMMIIAPMHGDSIVKSITQMTKSYEAKKLILVEKKATTLGQLVIPLIVMAFFPTFLFVVFAPLLSKITDVF